MHTGGFAQPGLSFKNNGYAGNRESAMNADETRSSGRGRPPRRTYADKRMPPPTRLRLPVREQLRAASQASGLSMAEELERRVEESFSDISRIGRLVDSLLQAASAMTGQS